MSDPPPPQLDRKWMISQQQHTRPMSVFSSSLEIFFEEWQCFECDVSHHRRSARGSSTLLGGAAASNSTNTPVARSASHETAQNVRTRAGLIGKEIKWARNPAVIKIATEGIHVTSHSAH